MVCVFHIPFSADWVSDADSRHSGHPQGYLNIGGRSYIALHRWTAKRGINGMPAKVLLVLLVAVEDGVGGAGEVGTADAGGERGGHQVIEVRCRVEIVVAELVTQLVHHRRQQVHRVGIRSIRIKRDGVAAG